ncbi:MAG: SurA N-terminal domain-containing protein [Minisyncoccales bacterium]
MENPKKDQKENLEGREKNTKKDNKGLKIVGIVVLILLAIGAIFYFTDIIPKDSLDLNNEEAEQVDEEEKAALVNGETISKGELEARVKQVNAQTPGTSSVTDQQKKQILQEMVDEELLYQEAKKEGVSADDQTIESEYQNTIEQFESEEQFQEALQENDLTEESLKKNIERGIVLNEYIKQIQEDSDVEVTEEEIQNFYDENIAGEEEAPELEEVKDQIEQQLLQEQTGQITNQKLEELKETADIQTFL